MSRDDPDRQGEIVGLAVFAVAGLHLLFVADTLWDAIRGLELEGDWYWIWRLGARIWDGQISGSYDIDEGQTLFWRYPPYVLYVAAAMALVPPAVAWWTNAAVQTGALWVAIRQLPTAPLVVATTVLVASAPFCDAIGAGQFSGVLLAVITVGSVLWSKGHDFVGGLVLGLLAAKPNWGLPFGLFALAIGQWRAAGGMLVTTALLVVASLPLGVDLWGAFVEMSLRNDQFVAMYDNRLQITLWGTLEGALPRGLARGAWWLGLCGMGAAVVGAVRRSSRLDQLAAVTLFTVAANPYASYYDALALAFPALVWHRRSAMGYPWWVTGGLIALIWFSAFTATKYHMILSTEPPPFTLTGLLVALWLIVEGFWRPVPAPASP